MVEVNHSNNKVNYSNPHFVDSGLTDTISLDDGSWVKIKAELGLHDQDVLTQKFIDYQIEAPTSREERKANRKSGNRPTQKARVNYQTVALLHVSIVDWSFADAEGNKIPITEETIGMLRPATARIIEEAIDERNPL